MRNFRYIITIKSVTGKGYSTPEDAANGNSVNNIDVDIEVERISDGTNYLFVTPTAITILNQENKTITFNYETDEESVTCPFTPASETSGAFTEVTPNSDGTISVKMKYYSGGVPNGKQNQTFKVKTPSGLYREVKVTLIDGFEFQNVTFTQNNEGNYEYSFTIPAGLEKSMFPLELFLFEESCSFSPLGDAMSVKLVDILDENGQKTGRQNWGYSATLDWEEYNQTTGYTYTYQFKANTTIDSNKTMTISNEYAKQDGTATYTLPVATISIVDQDAQVDGILSWNANTEENAQVTPQTAKVNITEGYEWEVVYPLEKFTFEIGENNIINIKPNNIAEGAEETLLVRAKEDNGRTASLKLQVVTSTLLNISKQYLRGSGDGFSYNNGIYEEEFIIYTDSEYNNNIGECSFERLGSSGNRYYQLKNDLSLEIPAGVETLYFVYQTEYYGYKHIYVATITVENLRNAADGTLQILNFQDQWQQ